MFAVGLNVGCLNSFPIVRLPFCRAVQIYNSKIECPISLCKRPVCSDAHLVGKYRSQCTQYEQFLQTMSWSSAQQYCRENYKDLAMVENQEENTEAKNAKPSSDLVWIGLYREPWTWSDGSKSSFRNWLPNTGLNNIDKNQHCITENPQHQWADEFCNIPWVFVCHQGEHLKKY
uniref:C-type lectin domain-containing protein n=1 Tax=Oryzias latipes TaxID=8090 RepID=H2MP93_ORYLA